MKEHSSYHKGQTPLYQQPQTSLKTVYFEVIHNMLSASQKLHTTFYYLITMIQAIQLLWFIIHPDFQLYGGSKFISPIRQISKIFNFHQYAKINNDFGYIIIIAGIAFITLQIILFIITTYQIKVLKSANQSLLTVQHTLFILFNTILIIPLFAISINFLYCDQTSLYHTGQTCYNESYIIGSILSVLILLIMIAQKTIYCYLYFDSNPFSVSFYSKNNSNAQFGKFILKVMPTIYFLVDQQLIYRNVYLFANVGLYGGYIFFFRLNSIHDFNQTNFYFSYFLQVFLTWFSFNNIILLYLQTEHLPGGVLQAIACGILISILMIYLEQSHYQKLFIEVIESKKIKKQNAQKFFYYLIYKFVYLKSDQQKSELNNALSILDQDQQKQGQQLIGNEIVQQKNKQKQYYFYRTTKKILMDYLKTVSQISLQCVLCNILMLQSYYSLAFYRSIQISTKKLSVVQQLALYRFRMNKRFQVESVQINLKQKNNIFRVYKYFIQNLIKLQALINKCALSNLEYWEQLQQYDPSIHKIRNLAHNYKKYQHKIDEIYEIIQSVFPNNKHFRKIYYQFLIYVGVVGTKQLNQAERKYLLAMQNQKNLLKFKKDKEIIDLGQNQNLTFISIDTAQNNKCNIINCNSQIKRLLDYEKQQILNKNVGKLMPKMFMDFHDDLVTNYIGKKQKNQKNKVERVVYAFNKQNILVEVGLFTKVNYRLNQNNIGLQLIGFLKKLDNGTKSLILIQMNSQLVIGFTQKFQKLIQYGINTTQIANNQVRLCSIIPKIQMEKIASGVAQIVTLVFTSKSKMTQTGINQQIKKKVEIHVQELKQYNGKLKLAYLNIQQIYKLSSSIDAKDNNLKKNKEKIPSISKLQIYKKSQPKLEAKVSIYKQNQQSQKESTKQVDINYANELQTQKNLALQRKKTDFVQNQGLNMSIKMIFIVMICFLLIKTVLSVMYSLINTTQTKNAFLVRFSIFKALNINYHTTVINLNIQKLIQASKYYTQTQFITFQDILNHTIQQSRTDLMSLLSQTQNFNGVIQLNFNQLHNFTIEQTIINQSIAATGNSLQSLSDAYFQYLSFSKMFSILSFFQIQKNFKGEYNQQNIFIQMNGRSIFLDSLFNIADQYQRAGAIFYDKYLKNQLIILFSMGVLLLLGFGLIYYFTMKINIFNTKTILLYNSSKLWEIRQMRLKILTFLKINEPVLYRSNSKRISSSSVLQLFPNQALIQILNKTSSNVNQNSRQLPCMKDQNDQKIEKKSNFQDITQKYQEQKLLQRKSLRNKSNVHLSQKNKINLKIFLISCLSLINIGIFYGLQYSVIEKHQQILNLNQQLMELCQMKSQFGAFNYYYYQIVIGNDKDIYYKLLNQNLKRFYQTAELQFDNTVQILKNTYSQVQEGVYVIQNYLINSKNGSTIFNVNNQAFLNSQKLFNKSAEDVNNFIFNSLQIQAQQIGSSIQNSCLMMTITQLIGTVVMCLIIYYWLLHQIINTSKKSQCMVELIPIWMLSRNKQLQKMLQQV